YISVSSGGAIVTSSVVAGNEIAILPQSTTDSYVVQTAEADFYISPTFFYGYTCSDPAWGSTTQERHMATSGGKAPPAKGNIQQVTNEGQQQINAKTVYLSPESFLLQVYPNPANDK